MIEIMLEPREDGWDNGDNYNQLNKMMTEVDEVLNRNVSSRG